MARLDVQPDRVRVQLFWWEKAAIRRSHLTIPRRAITGVTVVTDTWDAVGEGRYEQSAKVPGLTRSGTVVSEDGSGDRTFALCHRRGPGLVLHLQGATFRRIVLSTPGLEAAEQYAEAIGV